jgi:hypothetical protein
MDLPEHKACGFGKTNAFYWIAENKSMVGGQQHIALGVDSPEKVHAFYQACIENGAKDNG